MSDIKLARIIIWKKQGGKCYYCERPTRLPKRRNTGSLSDDIATLDHIVPKSRGGDKSTRRNCVVACFRCNNDRGTKDARMFMLERMGMLA